MKKRLCSLFLISSLLLSGCSSSDIRTLKSLESVNSDTSVASVSMSASDKESAIYSQVSDRVLIDLASLDEIPESDINSVQEFMEKVDQQLTGTLSESDGVLPAYFVNYLLGEFERTPYYWQRSKMVIIGMDASSRSLVVDVTYKTIDFEKEVKPDSRITLGEPNAKQKEEVRFERYLQIMSGKFSGNSRIDWQSALVNFEEVYGAVNEIVESQRNLSLYDLIYETGNQITYTGLQDSDSEVSHAEMTVRYIVSPNFTLGINQGYSCNHMYLTSYKLLSDPTEGLELYKEDGISTITSAIYSLLTSYYTCVDTFDYDGLYRLSNNFERLDKYYKDIETTAYVKHDNFTISIFDISGTHVTCGVSVSKKIRAKGSDMTYPLYTDKYLYTFDLVGEDLKVSNEVLISSTLEGEPVIDTKVADTTGFTSSVILGVEDKQTMEKLIASFGALQMNNDITSDTFASVVDLSISTSLLNNLKTSMQSLSGVKKVTWISAYLQGQSNYASIRCKELVEKDTGSIYEASVTYDFINKGDKWYIYNYSVNSNNRLDTTTLTTKNSLCICTAGNIDSFNSQVTSASTAIVTDSAIGNIGFTVEYDSYTPVIRERAIKDDNLKNFESMDAFWESLSTLYTTDFKSYNGDDEFIILQTSKMGTLLSDKSFASYTSSFFTDFDEESVSNVNLIDSYNSLLELAESLDSSESVLSISDFTKLNDTIKSVWNSWVSSSSIPDSQGTSDEGTEDIEDSQG